MTPSIAHRRPAGMVLASVSGRVGWLVILVVALLATAAAALWWTSRDRSLVEVQKRGTIRIGYAVEAPYAFLTEAGQVTGMAPETARRVAQLMGLSEPEWVLVEFSALISGLKSGRFDVIAAGMFITPEREELIAFSEPLIQVRPGLLVAKGNPHQLNSLATAVAKPEARLAVLDGSVELNRMAGLGVSPERLVVVPDAATGLNLVATGRADALALSQPTVLWMASQAGAGDRVEAVRLPQMLPEESTDRTAFGFRTRDRQLRAEWNRHLQVFLQSPEKDLLARRFKFTSAPMTLRRHD